MLNVPLKIGVFPTPSPHESFREHTLRQSSLDPQERNAWSTVEEMGLRETWRQMIPQTSKRMKHVCGAVSRMSEGSCT